MDLSTQKTASELIDSLHTAAKNQDVEAIRALLADGVEVDARDNEGNTPLMKAMYLGVTTSTRRAASLLVFNGADVNAVNNAGQSVLMSDSALNVTPALNILLSLGAKVHNPKAIGSVQDRFEFSSDRARSIANEILEGRNNIPQIDPEKIANKSELFTFNEQGYLPLDDPENWQKLPQISEALQKKGQPLCKADFQMALKDLSNCMERAVECGSYVVLSDVLRELGDPIKGADFKRQDDGMPNGLALLAEEMWLGETVFSTVGHWKDSSTAEIKAFREELPDALREQFGNMHLIVEARRQQEATQQQSRGR